MSTFPLNYTGQLVYKITEIKLPPATSQQVFRNTVGFDLFYGICRYSENIQIDGSLIPFLEQPFPCGPHGQ